MSENKVEYFASFCNAIKKLISLLGEPGMQCPIYVTYYVISSLVLLYLAYRYICIKMRRGNENLQAREVNRKPVRNIHRQREQLRISCTAVHEFIHGTEKPRRLKVLISESGAVSATWEWE